MKELKVIFMGTPEFSVPILKKLIDYVNVIMVVTQKDAYIGRKKTLTPSPIKQLALSHNIPVYTPTKIRDEYQEIINAKPDLIITCAYGQIIPKVLLDLPKFGCINIHGSLLPKYRGGAPIHHAIMNGEQETGITLMYMAEGMDDGDILVKESIPILDSDNIETLSNKLSNLGSIMIIKYLKDILDGKIKPQKQDAEQVTIARIVKREHEHINFNDQAKNVYNKIRALTPNPLANFYMDEVEYKIGKCEICNSSGIPSTIVENNKDNIVIKCGDNAIKIYEIKPTGKNMMSIKDFKNGYHEELKGKIIE